MLFDPENKINKLCAAGMQAEGEGRMEHAAQLFRQAWDEAGSDTERIIAAHYLARQQPSVADKLNWDTTALNLALHAGTDDMNALLPSLYLNVAKCHEDLHDSGTAQMYYQLALRYSVFLAGDGYGNMIKGGIASGIQRTAGFRQSPA